jgi:hypothetical protein
VRLACALALVALVGGRAAAQPVWEEVKPPGWHSPQHFALEVKMGPYSPNIDSSPGLNGQTPFADLYNNQYDPTQRGKRPSGKPLTSIEFDYQFLHGFGSLGVGVSWGYQRRTTHGFNYVVDAMGNPIIQDGHYVSCTVGSCIRSSDVTALNVMPMTLELVYRFDVLALRYHVPLVPYLKGGLGYYFWFVQKGDGSLSDANTTMPRIGGTDLGYGGTFGLVAHPGLAVMLDEIDYSAARSIDAELGINHAYVFAELNYGWITGFGSSTKMVLSDTTWNCGLAFEF